MMSMNRRDVITGAIYITAGLALGVTLGECTEPLRPEVDTITVTPTAPTSPQLGDIWISLGEYRAQQLALSMQQVRHEAEDVWWGRYIRQQRAEQLLKTGNIL